MESGEKLTAEALVFGAQGLRRFIEKFSPDDDPSCLHADLAEADRLLNASSTAEDVDFDEGIHRRTSVPYPFSNLAPTRVPMLTYNYCGIQLAPEKLCYRANVATFIGYSAEPCNSKYPCEARAKWHCDACKSTLCGWCNAIRHGCFRQPARDGNGSKRSERRVQFTEPLVSEPLPSLLQRSLPTDQGSAVEGDDSSVEVPRLVPRMGGDDVSGDSGVQVDSVQSTSDPVPALDQGQPPTVHDSSQGLSRRPPPPPLPRPPPPPRAEKPRPPPKPQNLTLLEQVHIRVKPKPAPKPKRLSPDAYDPSKLATALEASSGLNDTPSPTVGIALAPSPDSDRSTPSPLKPALRRKPSILKGRKLFTATTLPVTGDSDANTVPVGFRRRANSEAKKMERLESDAAGEGPAAIAAKFRLKAMKQRLQVRQETDEAREILSGSYDRRQPVTPAVHTISEE